MVAITENTIRDDLSITADYMNKINEKKVEILDLDLDQTLHERSMRTLDAIKARIWKENWPLVTEIELNATGPWTLKPYQYHNYTFWPWITGINACKK